MKGYRTIIVNIIALVASLSATQGLEIGAEDQASIATAVLAIINIGLRFITTTPVGDKQ